MADGPLGSDRETDLFSDGRGPLYTNRDWLKTDRYHVVVTVEDARIAALAAEQFHEHGITATGVDGLSRAAGISKRTLYQRFGSKDGLIAAAYDALDLPVFEMFTKGVEAEADDPRDQLLAFFAQLEPLVRSPQFRGCPFSNAASELADPLHPAHEIVRRHKERIRRWILGRAKAAGAANPQKLSRQLMLVFAGVQSQALLERSSRPARDAHELARALIDAAIAPRQ
jgi:AcrR family transcriptional regulator